jgi:hypothetical protein
MPGRCVGVVAGRKAEQAGAGATSGHQRPEFKPGEGELTARERDECRGHPSAEDCSRHGDGDGAESAPPLAAGEESGTTQLADL